MAVAVEQERVLRQTKAALIGAAVVVAVLDMTVDQVAAAVVRAVRDQAHLAAQEVPAVKAIQAVRAVDAVRQVLLGILLVAQTRALVVPVAVRDITSLAIRL